MSGVSNGGIVRLGPAREGLDQEQQEILGQLEARRQEFGPLQRKAQQAIARQMRVYDEIKDLERRLEAVNEAIRVLA